MISDYYTYYFGLLVWKIYGPTAKLRGILIIPPGKSIPDNIFIQFHVDCIELKQFIYMLEIGIFINLWVRGKLAPLLMQEIFSNPEIIHH